MSAVCLQTLQLCRCLRGYKEKREVALLNNKAQREDHPPEALAELECQTKLGKNRKIDRKNNMGR
jgi:hypothetical protein